MQNPDPLIYINGSSKLHVFIYAIKLFFFFVFQIRKMAAKVKCAYIKSNW